MADIAEGVFLREDKNGLHSYLEDKKYLQKKTSKVQDCMDLMRPYNQQTIIVVNFKFLLVMSFNLSNRMMNFGFSFGQKSYVTSHYTEYYIVQTGQEKQKAFQIL